MTLPVDLEAEIQRLKKERNAVLLAHYYQESEIQDVADFIGDSLQLSQEAAKTKADVICFAGVHFMAETAKILNPQRTVVLPDLEAGCSLASGCPADRFAAWIARHPGSVVVSYINCTAEVKALSDYIVTSSNAEKIVRSILERTRRCCSRPTRTWALTCRRRSGREMVLCGRAAASCTRPSVSAEARGAEGAAPWGARHRAPGMRAGRCSAMADYIGSTTSLLKYAVSSPAKEFIVVTESGILHQMQKAAPEKTFIPAPPDANCACNECPFMRKNTLEKVYLSLRDLTPRIEMSPDLIARARKPIERMLALS